MPVPETVILTAAKAVAIPRPETHFMRPWGIGPLMRYMSKSEQILTLCRLQQYTTYNPVFCLDNGECLTLLVGYDNENGYPN